ncbi:DUF817 domain-containing protein [Lignipirellula cremea]|uniref:Integral membrane protein n=1 Tax=Lignipirellula cremea TaxID=2528010 RepID=A0A518DPZ4_9BACT|nr:DUF817 domain-containing protein [Lignipirellula cremea]QDU93912.1 hypothetical protein Pla8534_16980 [Lignipirellula cremea]
MSPLRRFLWEFWLFGIKQASACIFGAFLLTMILVTRFYYPADAWLYRYDFLLLLAVAFQASLLLFRMETPKEALVIIIFHVVATGMEVFKTSGAIGAWAYPEPFTLGIGNVPLFAGFMYSAVGSYIARVWRIFDFRFSYYPPVWQTWLLVALIYINFFSHHYTVDLRWPLTAATVCMFFRSQIYFKMDQKHRHMPLLTGWLLVALFIWFAENIATYAGIWVYPAQANVWKMVPLEKLGAWFLLMILSFVLAALVQRPQLMRADGSDTGEPDKEKDFAGNASPVPPPVSSSRKEWPGDIRSSFCGRAGAGKSPDRR